MAIADMDPYDGRFWLGLCWAGLEGCSPATRRGCRSRTPGPLLDEAAEQMSYSGGQVVGSNATALASRPSSRGRVHGPWS